MLLRLNDYFAQSIQLRLFTGWQKMQFVQQENEQGINHINNYVQQPCSLQYCAKP